MNTVARIISVFCTGLLPLAGCITTARTGRVFDEIQQPTAGMAALYIYAPPTGMPVLGQMSTKIFINDKAVARIDETYYTQLELLPGTYRIHASTDSQAACGGRLFPGTRYPPVTMTALPNQIYFMRYSSQPIVRRASTCDRYLRIIERDIALSELKGLHEIKNTFRQTKALAH